MTWSVCIHVDLCMRHSCCAAQAAQLRCRHLEIGRESHKLIDAKVQKQGLEVVSEAFDFGMHLPLPSAYTTCALSVSL